MNLLRPRVIFSWSLPRSYCNQGKILGQVTRKYATHRDSVDPSLVSPSLDTNRPVRQSVGPFQLGVSQSPFSKEKPVKKWSELSAGGKVKRTTERTTNLTVILLGAGLSVVLIYCLTSELFSKNSPTVLHSNACERIKASPQVAKFIHGPLAFHNNPPSSLRPRHRNHHVNSQLVIDSSGREHMILNFYIQGRPPGSEPLESDLYLEAATSWMKATAAHLSDLTWDEVVAWTQRQTEQTWQESKRIFKYLIGSPMPSSSSEQTSPPVEEVNRSQQSSFLGMFSSLKGSRQSSRASPPEGHTFTEGEVHADLIRNNDGYFVYRYLLIDMPSSRSRKSRVFVERGPGVREDEAVMRWNS